MAQTFVSTIPVKRYFRPRNWLALFLIVMAIITIITYAKLRGSLPQLDGSVDLHGLAAPVTVSSDRFAVPTINAGSRLDAYRTLGFITARDRLFQLELLRRTNSGKLAEIFGPKLAKMDILQRHLGLDRAAAAIVKALPLEQKQILESYTAGVNSFIAQSKALPFEFEVLRIQPEPWQPKDSILVALGMFQVLNLVAHKERMLTSMGKYLPSNISAFLTPDTDIYTHTLIGGADSHRPIQPLPVDAIKTLYQSQNPQASTGIMRLTDPLFGSNSWAVNRLKTADGRADKDSRAFGILFRWRKKLAGEVLLPLMQRCFDNDSSFYYSWFNMDTPLRQLLKAQPVNALPQKDRYQNWDALILGTLEYTVSRIKQEHAVDNISDLRWADLNVLKISHPFSRGMAILSPLLDMPVYKLSGCTFCINVVRPNYGVSERLVVSPEAISEAIFHMPTGQSGHPLCHPITTTSMPTGQLICP